MEVYKPQQIRDVILNCGQDYKEWDEGDTIRYYFHPSDKVVQLDMNKAYMLEEIELLIPHIGISMKQFEELYKKQENTNFDLNYF